MSGLESSHAMNNPTLNGGVYGDLRAKLLCAIGMEYSTVGLKLDFSIRQLIVKVRNERFTYKKMQGYMLRTLVLFVNVGNLIEIREFCTYLCRF